MNWISVEDRLPEEDAIVMISAGKYGTCVGSFNHMWGFEISECNNMILVGDEELCITHWMPLPKPPKESEE